jgi:hypothetical protein
MWTGHRSRSSPNLPIAPWGILSTTSTPLTRLLEDWLFRMTKRRGGRSNSRPVAIAKAAIVAVTGKEYIKLDDTEKETDECISNQKPMPPTKTHADRLNLADENLATHPMSSKAIGSRLSPPLGGFTSASPGASASWPHIGRPVSPCQWTSATHAPYQTQFYGTLDGIYPPPIDDLADNRYWRNPIEPIQRSLPWRLGKRVGEVRNHAFFDDLTDFLKACNLCRQGKAKCDGEKPCSRCNEKGVQCHYLGVRQTKYVQSSLIPG